MSEETGQRVTGFTTAQVCELAHVRPSTLNSWTYGDEPLVTPSLVGSAGKRNDRYWSVQDLVTVRTINALRRAGCPLQQVRLAQKRIAEVWESDLASTMLYWDGSDLIATDQWGDVQSMIKHPGQSLLHVVAVPLLEWQRQAQAQAEELDIEKVKARRARNAVVNRQPERTAQLRANKT